MILSNKINKVFVQTNNLSFFYKLNRGFNRFEDLKFKVVNFKDLNYIPDNSILLTTENEAEKLTFNNTDNKNLITYNENDDFDRFLFNVLKIYRCGPNKHSRLLFSIDPGKTVGLIVFLDGHYFYSKTFYTNDDLLANVNQCVEYIGENSKDTLHIIFKFGRGVLTLTLELIREIYDQFQEKQQKDIKIFLINESKSSKIKLHKIIKTLSKHEASALILSLRKGVEVNQDTYEKFFKLKKSSREIKEKIEEELEEISFLYEHPEILINLSNKLIKGNISIYKAYKVINKKTNSHIFIES